MLCRLVKYLNKASSARALQQRAAGVWPPPATFAEWRAVNRSTWWFVSLACCFKISIINVVYCRAFGAKAFSAPVVVRDEVGREHTDAQVIARLTSVMASVEDVPQLVAAAAVTTLNGQWNEYTAAATVVLSCLTVAHELAVACDVGCLTRGPGAPTARATGTGGDVAIGAGGQGGAGVNVGGVPGNTHGYLALSPSARSPSARGAINSAPQT